MTGRRRRTTIRVREPGEERRPLLSRAAFSHAMDGAPLFSCSSNTNTLLPVYTNIHRIRRDVISIVEDYLTFEQLRDLRLNLSVVRPMVDKLYELDDISIGTGPPPIALVQHSPTCFLVLDDICCIRDDRGCIVLARANILFSLLPTC